ncbi:spondin domain-containing protein [uncultured Psychroserpens sp.]|uniref:T9SS type A sorting domain-containing protein n=1 Tax=uncultured Psychroserpens sp. TaxID=255436 RepID=UPI00260D53C2|nr:spondin domain-containing protein [uncultured Psychroserpens sp.]
MKNITLVLKPLIYLSLLCFVTTVMAQSTASYNITFSSDWENETVDPVKGNSTAPIPGNAHWSNLVGTTHNSDYTMVRMGMLASTGIKNVAEAGNNTALMNEINSTGDANQWLQQGFSPFAAISSATLSNVVVSTDYPLLSLVSMIAPSPDWMIAIDAINLRDGNTWRNEIIIPLFPYDAGTDSGTMYGSPNQVTTPFQPISVLINQGPFNDKPIGTMTITLNQVLSVDEQSLTEVAVYPNPTNGILNIRTSNANPLKMASIYDVLGKQVVSLQNTNSRIENNLDLTALNKGVYLVRIEFQDGSSSTKKVILN